MSKKTKPGDWYPKQGEHYWVLRFPGLKPKRKDRRKPLRAVVSSVNHDDHIVTADLHWQDCEEIGCLSATATIGWAHLKRNEEHIRPSSPTLVPLEDVPIKPKETNNA